MPWTNNEIRQKKPSDKEDNNRKKGRRTLDEEAEALAQCLMRWRYIS